MNMLSSAVYLAGKGLRVFPLVQDGRKPLVEGWQERATADLEQIRGMFLDPILNIEKGLNYGVTGGLIVDVDVKNGKNGVASLNVLSERLGPLPETLTVQTPSGGYHYYFQGEDDIGNTCSGVAKGVDIKSKGGYVVGPGSTLGDNMYKLIHDVEVLPKLPQLWKDELVKLRIPVNNHEVGLSEHLVDSDQAIENARHYLKHEAPPSVEGNSGDDNTIKVVRMVRDYGISSNLCYGLMLEHWNETCMPPWSEKELKKKVESGYKNTQNAIGCRSAQALFSVIEADDEEEFSANDEGLEHTSETRLLYNNTRYKFTSASQMVELPSLKWIVKGVIPDVGVGVIYGPSSCGKSFLALDLSRSIVSGSNWFGHKVSKKSVSYIALEGGSGFGARLQAIVQNNDASLEQLKVMTSQAFNLMNTTDIIDLAESIIATSGRGGVIIIDTLNQSAVGLDENSSSSMSRVICNLKDLQKHTESMVLVVHHTGKIADRGMRGHSSLHAAIDVAIEVSVGQNNKRSWKQTKNREGVSYIPHPFELKVVEIGVDADNDVVTSCIIVPDESPEANEVQVAAELPLVKPHAKHQKVALDVLITTTTDSGRITMEEAIKLVAPKLDCEKGRQRGCAIPAINAMITKGMLKMDGNLIVVGVTDKHGFHGNVETEDVEPDATGDHDALESDDFVPKTTDDLFL